ncbi:MAG: alpha-N-arabinofuranosidase [Rhodanobacteraceae bacterium]
MDTTKLTLHTGFAIGAVDPRVFGGFIEHMGRCVYEGLYQPGSRQADAHGYRKDVLGALAQLRFTAMRYPGGNFVSGYHWRDGVGPVSARPTRYEMAWHSIEPNRFGTNEFMRLARQMGWSPMLAVNLGTGTVEEAARYVEYCNLPAGTVETDARAAHLTALGLPPAPHGVKLWCLGNEMDGPWQVGHRPARDYAITANSAGRAMKMVDPTVELVVCGSCGTGMHSYMAWDREVLELTADTVEYVSLHRYVGNRENDTANYLAVTNSIDKQIEEMDACCRFVQAQRRMERRVQLCFDEWNVWYKDMTMDGKGVHAPHLIEEVYNLEDALVVAGFLMSFLRHADCVKIANLAQVVNIIAPILTRGDEMLVQTIFHPIRMIADRREGVSLRTALTGPRYKSKSYGEANRIDAAAIFDAAGKRLSVFLTNRSQKETATVAVDLADLRIDGVVSAEVVTGKNAKAVNRFGRPPAVAAAPLKTVAVKGGTGQVKLPALGFAAVTFSVRG